MSNYLMKLTRKAVSCITCVSVFLTAVMAGFTGINLSVVATNGVWAGSGTEADPYEIADEKDLREVIKCGGMDAGGNRLYFELVNDIALNNTDSWSTVNFESTQYTQWEKVKNDTVPAFRGDLQGNGHTISGLFATGEGGASALFPIATGGANVSNLKIDKAYININNYAGAVFGRVVEGNAGSVNVSYVYVTNAYIKTYQGACAAGLVGAAHHGGSLNIQGCAFILGEKGGVFGAYTGAMLGDAWSCSVSIGNCWSSGYPLVKHATKTKTWNISNCYTDVSPNVEIGAGSFLGVVSNMKGANETICPNLDNKVTWQFNSNDYPTLKNVLESVNGTEGEVWSGATAKVFAGGTGTKIDPYIIKTGEQLFKMISEKRQGAYYQLDADIYLNDISKENWHETALPWAIGSSEPWELHLEGNGHKISGLYINSKGQYGYSGLVPVAGNDTSITNVHIVDSYISGQKTAFENYSAAFIGFVAEGAFNIVIGGCTVASSVVFGGGCKGAGFIGGMTSHGSAIIFNCGFAGTMDPSLYSSNYAAGFLADSWTQGGGLAIYNSYCCGVPAVWKANGNTTATSLYTTVDQEATEMKTLKVVVLDETQMKGEAAKANMSFDWDAWQTVPNNFPIPSFNYDRRDGTPGKVWSGLCAQNYEPYTADYAYPAGFVLENPADPLSRIVDAVTGEYFYGDGTDSYPYHIATGEQLYKLVSQNTNLFGAEDEEGVNVCYKLIADIYLNDVQSKNWEDKVNLNQWFVGTQGGAFRGHFDGNGHIVVGMYYDRLGNNCTYGLFPVLGEDGIVENVGVVSAYINGQGLSKGYNEFAGAIVGYISDYGDPGTTTAKLVREELEALGYTLPIIRRCFADVDTVIRAKYAGGIVCGIPSPFIIEDCYFLGTIRGTISAGVIGDAWPKNVINANRCYCITSDNDRFANGNWANGGVKKNCFAFSKIATREVTYLYALLMRGESARTYMPGFFDGNDNWMTVEGGSPVLKVFGDRAIQFSDTKYRPTVVEFATNTDECSFEPLIGTFGDPVTLPTPTRKGYEFDGWYYYKELQCKAEFTTLPMVGVTLYANWVKNTVTQDFENYPDTKYDRNQDGDYEIYRPGAAGYTGQLVHNGSKSLHRMGKTTTEEDVLLNYEDTLVKNTIYEVSFWVTTDEADAKATVSLVRNTWPDIDIANEPITGVEEMAKIENLTPGEWKQYTFKFTADTEWVSLRTTGGASLFFDDFEMVPIEVVNVSTSQTGGNTADGTKPVDTTTTAPTAPLSPATADNSVSLVALISAFAAAAVVLLFSKKHLTEVIDN